MAVLLIGFALVCALILTGAHLVGWVVDRRERAAKLRQLSKPRLR